MTFTHEPRAPQVSATHTELRRTNAALIAENARLRTALTQLMRHFPTDIDMDAAGWAQHEINEACDAHDAARSALSDNPAQERRPLGCALAMRVLQSDLYRGLDDAQRADCDELVRRNLEWCKATDNPARSAE